MLHLPYGKKACVRTLALAGLLAAIGAGTAWADPDVSVPPVSKRAPQLRLSEETVSLPIMMVREYPFVEAVIAGVAGKLMLDTGYEGALIVNDHRVATRDGQVIGRGFFGSGETFEVKLVPELTDVRIAHLTFDRVTDVTTQDARLLETITPDFLGWLGYTAFATHALELDYRRLLATFHAPGQTPGIANERVLADLAYETRRLPNHPLMAGRLGDLAVVTSWDTGQYGTLYTTEAVKAEMLADGRLVPSPAGPDAWDLRGLELSGQPMPMIVGISVETQPSPAAAAKGVTEAHELVIGYAFLRQFRTLWDFPRRRILLLEP